MSLKFRLIAMALLALLYGCGGGSSSSSDSNGTQSGGNDDPVDTSPAEDSFDSPLYLTNINHKQVIAEADVEISQYYTMELTSSGDVMVVTLREDDVVLLDTNNNLAVLDTYARGRANTDLESIALSPDGNTLYLAHQKIGVEILDISDPTNITYITETTLAGTDLFDIKLSGDGSTLFVGEWGLAGFSTLDVSDLGNIRLLDSDTGYGVANITLNSNNTIAYVTTDSGEIKVFDISDPANFALLDTHSYSSTGGGTTFMPASLSPNEDYLVVAVFSGGGIGVDVIDVSTPSNLSTLYSLDEDYRMADVDWSDDGSELYASISGKGIVTFDATNIATQLVEKETQSVSASTVALHPHTSSDTLYVLDYYFGPFQISETNLNHPHIIGLYEADVQWTDIIVDDSESTLYAAGDDKVIIIDITDKTSPQLLSTITVTDAEGVNLVGENTLIISDEDSGLYIMDVTNKAAPVELDNYALRGSGYGYDTDLIEGTDLLVVTNYDYGLEVLDISQLDSPVFQGEAILNDYQIESVISHDGNWVFSADYGLSVTDISTPTSPAYIGKFDFDINNEEELYEIDIDSNRDIVMVASDKTSYSSYIHFADVSQPESLSFTGEYTSKGYVDDFKASKNLERIYAAQRQKGVSLIDTADISFGMESNYFFSTGGRSSAVAASNGDNYLYVGDDYRGIVIVDTRNTTQYLESGFGSTELEFDVQTDGLDEINVSLSSDNESLLRFGSDSMTLPVVDNKVQIPLIEASLTTGLAVLSVEFSKGSQSVTHQVSVMKY